MKVHLISYATPDYRKNQIRLSKSALKFGVDTVKSYSPRDISRTPFYKSHKNILNHKRGAGYWLWKPYVILNYMQKVDDGDVVIYSDVGCEIVDDLSPLINLCLRNNIVLFRTHGRFNKQWTKRDCFVLMNCDTVEYHNGEQLVGGFQLYLKNDQSMEFIKEYLHFCQDERIITDSINSCGLENFPEFKDHRHDQSILSLLAIKHKLEIYRDPSQYGNHMKIDELREPGEYLEEIYSSCPYTNSPYRTLLDQHRERPKKNLIFKLKRFFRTSNIKKYLRRVLNF